MCGRHFWVIGKVRGDIFKIMRKMITNRKDVAGEQCKRMIMAALPCMTKNSETWVSYNLCLLHEEFEWERNC